MGEYRVVRHLVRASAVGALLLLSLRLFTYEFSLADDPTCGIALRPWPSLRNRCVLRSSAELRGSVVLVQDELRPLGVDLYHLLLRADWLAVAVLALSLGWTLRRRRS